MSNLRGKPRTLPFLVEVMEGRPLASQAFVARSGRAYLPVVAPPGGAPGAVDLQAILARADQAESDAPGLWHHPLRALEAESDLPVIDRAGRRRNCDEIALDRPVAPALAHSAAGLQPRAAVGMLCGR